MCTTLALLIELYLNCTLLVPSCQCFTIKALNRMHAYTSSHNSCTALKNETGGFCILHVTVNEHNK